MLSLHSTQYCISFTNNDIEFLYITLFIAHGYLSNWTEWANCGASCGEMNTTRNRFCIPPGEGGDPCPDEPLTDTGPCNLDPCPGM